MNVIERATKLLYHCLPNQRGYTAVDGGAFRGAVVQQLLNTHRFSKIVAYEPDPDSFRRLSENIEAGNSVHFRNLALGSTAGESTFYRGEFPATNSLLPRPTSNAAQYFPKSARHNNTSRVGLIDLDSELRELFIDRVNFLKLDLQGGELEALKGAISSLRLGLIDIIVCEVVFVRKYEQQPLFHTIASFLEGFHYSLYSIEDLKIGNYDEQVSDVRAGQWNQADAIFLSPNIRASIDKDSKLENSPNQ